jgi:acetyl-CoA carboxylase beta subunit
MKDHLYKCDKCNKVFDESEMDFSIERDLQLCLKCADEYRCKAELLKEFLDRPENKKGV